MDNTINNLSTIQDQIDELQKIISEGIALYKKNSSFIKLLTIAVINLIPTALFIIFIPVVGGIINHIISSAMNKNNKDIKSCASEINSMLKKDGRNEKEISINLHEEGGFTQCIRRIFNAPRIQNGFKVQIVTYNSQLNQKSTLPIFANSNELTEKLKNESEAASLEKNTKKTFNGKSKGALMIHGTYGTGKTYLAEQFAVHSFGKIGVYLKIECSQFQDAEKLKSFINNIKYLLITLSNQINDPNALIVLNFDETDVRPDFFKVLQEMLDNEFPAITKNNQFKTSRMLICTTNKIENLNSNDRNAAKASQRLKKYECLAYSQNEFLSLLNEEHGKSWIKAISKEKNYNDNNIQSILNTLKTKIPEFAKQKLSELIKEIISIKKTEKNTIFEIINYMKEQHTTLIEKYSMLHLLLSHGKLECLEHKYNEETIKQFNTFLESDMRDHSQNTLIQYLIENCKFLDFRTIERDVALPIINRTNINIGSATLASASIERTAATHG